MIYDAMYKAKIIKKRQFAICLGKDGGYMQIGGYDKWQHIGDTEEDKELKWMKLLNKNTAFRVPLRGLMMNNHMMADSDS